MRHEEDGLCITCARWWELMMPAEERFGLIHIPNGGARNKIEGAKFKKMGVRAGVPDYLIQKRGFPVGWMEFKAGKNKLTEGQKAFRQYCGLPFAEIRSLNDFINTLRIWGVIS